MKRIKAEKIPESEKEQVRARHLLGHTFALRTDDHGRRRLAGGTAEAQRLFDISTSGETVRVRTIDPLKGISSLSNQMRDAGARYRADFEFSANEGLKNGSQQEHVDGGKHHSEVAQRLMASHSELAGARKALAYDEIVHVLDAVCGLGMSISQIATLHGSGRDIPVQLLRMGLSKLSVFYGIVSKPKRT